MSSINEKLAQAQEKAIQLERQKKLQDNRVKEQQRKAEIRLQIIVGKMVIKHFPEVLQFQPRQTEAENRREFILLDDFLALLAYDKQYVERLKSASKSIRLQKKQFKNVKNK